MPQPSPFLARLRDPRPFVHEWIVLAYFAISFALLERMPVTYPRSALLLAYGRPVLIIMALAGLVAFVRWRRDRNIELGVELTSLLRIALLLLVTWAVHFLLKSFIFVINPRTWDLQLAALDQTVHLGFDPGVFLTTLIQAPAALQAIDLLYSRLYYFVVIGYTAVLLALLPGARKMAFGAAFTLLWAAGSLLYLAFPSWGPVYVFPAIFEPVLQHMPITVGVQSVLYEEISSLVRNPTGLRYVRFGSVAAFPSLHVGAVVLYALASRGLSRTWFRINLALVAAMVVGSVMTGYHYLVDAWAGAALAAGLWWIARRLFARWEPKTNGAAEAAPEPLQP